VQKARNERGAVSRCPSEEWYKSGGDGVSDQARYRDIILWQASRSQAKKATSRTKSLVREIVAFVTEEEERGKRMNKNDGHSGMV
jgi:hypothetical protein